MKRRRGNHERLCPYCGETYVGRKLLVTKDGVTEAVIHTDSFCTAPDEPIHNNVHSFKEALFAFEEE
jgi:hypothetical protein